MAETASERDDELRQQARQRARAKMGFYQHLLVYVVVNGFLLALNLLTGPGSLWFYWPLLGWGIGLLAHAGGVFASDFGAGLSRRMEDKELEKLRKRQEPSDLA
ncbi:MAG: 2TM domain-containing protein [Chloroflexota bacterium]|nr:2TM domain-containing protein [Chloroflexota bacterium]MDE2961386.1 2TM domain-containing protein [Chloroflexota bacterium]